MSVPNTTRIKRRPTHPGEMLREDFLPDYGLTVSRLAEVSGVSRQSINELLRGRRAVSPEMAAAACAAIWQFARVLAQRPAGRGFVGCGSSHQERRISDQAASHCLAGLNWRTNDSGRFDRTKTSRFPGSIHKFCTL